MRVMRTYTLAERRVRSVTSVTYPLLAIARPHAAWWLTAPGRARVYTRSMRGIAIAISSAVLGVTLALPSLLWAQDAVPPEAPPVDVEEPATAEEAPGVEDEEP